MANYTTGSGNHTFDAQVQTDNITNEAGSGLPTLNGTSPEFKWQSKVLSANVTTTTATISDLTFNGLTTGKTYRAQITFNVNSVGGSTDDATVTIDHNGSVLATCGVINVIAGKSRTYTISALFEASASSVTFGAVIVGSSQILGNNTRTANGTWVELQEFPYADETTDFT